VNILSPSSNPLCSFPSVQIISDKQMLLNDDDESDGSELCCSFPGTDDTFKKRFFPDDERSVKRERKREREREREK